MSRQPLHLDKVLVSFRHLCLYVLINEQELQTMLTFPCLLSPFTQIYVLLCTYQKIVNAYFLGPCGGKTTGQARLSTFFESLGWKVFSFTLGFFFGSCRDDSVLQSYEC